MLILPSCSFSTFSSSSSSSLSSAIVFYYKMIRKKSKRQTEKKNEKESQKYQRRPIRGQLDLTVSQIVVGRRPGGAGATTGTGQGLGPFTLLLITFLGLVLVVVVVSASAEEKTTTKSLPESSASLLSSIVSFRFRFRKSNYGRIILNTESATGYKKKRYYDKITKGKNFFDISLDEKLFQSDIPYDRKIRSGRERDYYSELESENIADKLDEINNNPRDHDKGSKKLLGINLGTDTTPTTILNENNDNERIKILESFEFQSGDTREKKKIKDEENRDESLDRDVGKEIFKNGNNRDNNYDNAVINSSTTDNYYSHSNSAKPQTDTAVGVSAVSVGVFGFGAGAGAGVGVGIDKELTTKVVPVPMSPRFDNPETQVIGDEILLHPKGGGRLKNHDDKDKGKEKKKKKEKEIENENEDSRTTQVPSPTHHPSMESPSGSSGYIISVSLVFVVGAIVGVLATVSHHFHRRYQRRLPDAPDALDAPGDQGAGEEFSNTENRYQPPPPPPRRRHNSATPMLSVSGGMEVGSGGRGGRGTLGASLQGGGTTTGNENEIVAATRDRAVRASSVRQDLALDLPPRLQLPDGEERPYGAHAGIHLRDPEQESEIYQKCVRPPPNRTVFDSESPPAYRSQSALLDTPDRIVRCHSAGSSLLKVFRKFPTSGSSTPSVIVPRRPTLSSYSESSSNLSNLSSLTVVPCETDETQNHV